MDFMSRLDSNVSAIDFNSSGSSGGLVKIHKRERSPISQTASTSVNTTSFENRSKKKYKLVDNNSISSFSQTSSQSLTSGSAASAKLNSFSCPNKPHIASSKDTDKEAPESRTDFLKEVRNFIH